MSDNEQTGLGSTFGAKTRGSQIGYGHPAAKDILAAAREVMNESETGRILLRVMDYHKIPVQIIRGTGESGFSPDLRVIYLQVSGKIDSAKNTLILYLVKALREADQEYAGFRAPDPMKDIMQYASFMHARNLDSVSHICKFVKELTGTSHFQEFVDTLPKLGLNGVYKAYIAGASKEELYKEYASAYNTIRGSN